MKIVYDIMSTPEQIFLEGHTIFKREKISLCFYFHTEYWICRVEKNDKKFDIIFSSIEDFNGAIEKFKNNSFEEKDEVNIDWSFIDSDKKETYTLDEFSKVISRLMDDIVFCCEICVSAIGGFNEFFHCEKCILEGGGFVVCRECAEENDRVCEEHENEFPHHKIESPEKENLLDLYISSIKDCIE